MAVIGHFIAMCLAVANGGGRHIIFVKDMRKYILGHVGKMVCYATGTMLVKISILLFYHRVFPQKPILIVSCLIGTIVILYNIALVLVVSLQCIPLSSIWTDRPGRCIDKSKPTTALAQVAPFHTTHCAINLFTDVATFAIPIKPVLGLKMRITRKLQVLAAFLLGGIVCVFGVIRTVVLSRMKPGDASQGDIFPGIWSVSEMSIGVVAAYLFYEEPKIDAAISKFHG
ncbi:hypothetical protein P170DRAFT_474887 [Aspergillus steynii IBT 23096]|uniref:Rhodopsin domain-containing protein n=1 Tax=Aspergillus steynii IBT 23096 TaxID=1392250 RepID=A0A2I2GEN5_9EURO|nr:uncharacterized protein P170DRAFT_474887 [Aspergillus steynii IBT 23096]PLB51344.1 hypothetical protein P170DRAFT_474887 [Aspergillus steynii IBT 23096]